jgi:hypothetical protein
MNMLVLKNKLCAKFGLLLGKTAVETVTTLKEAVKFKSMSKYKCMSGLIISKEVKCLLKTNHVVDPLPRMKQVLKWRRFAKVAEIQRESLAALESISV